MAEPEHSFFGAALIGALVQAYFSNRFGRKTATGIAAVLLIIGNALQAGAVDIAMFLVGRYLTGLGSGMVVANTPVYVSEISPAHSRGLLVGLQGNFIVTGYIISSCAALGFNYVTESFQWRLNFVIATFFALVLLAVLFFIPESPRWLVEHDRAEEAAQILNRIHKTRTDPEGAVARAEFVQIQAQIELEKSSPTSWLHIIRSKSLRKRLICTLLVWTMAQSTGITVLANLTPTLFGGLGYGTVLQLVLSLVWTVCLWLGCFVNIYLIDKIGRVKLIGKTPSYSGLAKADFGDSLRWMVIDRSPFHRSGIAGLRWTIESWRNERRRGHLLPDCILLHLHIGMYRACVSCMSNAHYCPCTNPIHSYGTEIWPTHLRSKGSAISYFGFFVWSIWTTAPAAQAFATIGWKYLMVFVAVTIALLIPCMFYLPEVRIPLHQTARPCFRDRH